MQRTNRNHVQVPCLHGPFQLDIGTRLLLREGPQVEAIARRPRLLRGPNLSIR